MKKIILASLIFFSLNSFGQSFTKNVLNRLSFGLKAGANYSDFSNASFDTDPLFGFHAGATIGFKLTNHFSIQEDFLYSRQGTTISEGDVDIQLNYLNVPILLRYSTKIGLYLEGGPQVSMLINEDVPGVSGDFAEPISVSLSGGIGYQSKMGLGFGMRYNAGLSNVTKLDMNPKPEFKNNVVQASMFYVFGKKK